MLDEIKDEISALRFGDVLITREGREQYSITIKNGGNVLALCPIPDNMTGDCDWYKDRVWFYPSIDVALNVFEHKMGLIRSTNAG